MWSYKPPPKKCCRCDNLVTLYTGRVCDDCLHSANERLKASRKAAFIRPKIRAAVWKRAHSRCEWCGIEVSPRRDSLNPIPGEIDHVTPAVDGGKGTLENLKLACRPCNRRREGQWTREKHRKLREV